MNRITPEQVVEAFRRHPEVRPTRWQFLGTRDGKPVACCGTTILAIDRGIKPPSGLREAGTGDGAAILAPLLGLDPDYLQGFACGFDFADGAGEYAEDDAAFDLGYSDGEDAWDAVAAEILTERGV